MSKEPSTFWAEPLRLKRLTEYREMGLSAGQIASAIGQGCTRNMVIGKLRRLNLSLLRLTVRGRGWQPDTPRKARTMKEPTDPIEAISEPVSLRIPFAQAKSRECRWISSDPIIDSSICGHDTLPNKSLCAYHAGRAFQPATHIRRETDAQ